MFERVSVSVGGTSYTKCTAELQAYARDLRSIYQEADTVCREFEARVAGISRLNIRDHPPDDKNKKGSQCRGAKKKISATSARARARGGAPARGGRGYQGSLSEDAPHAQEQQEEEEEEVDDDDDNDAQIEIERISSNPHRYWVRFPDHRGLRCVREEKVPEAAMKNFLKCGVRPRKRHRKREKDPQFLY